MTTEHPTDEILGLRARIAALECQVRAFEGTVGICYAAAEEGGYCVDMCQGECSVRHPCLRETEAKKRQAARIAELEGLIKEARSVMLKAQWRHAGIMGMPTCPVCQRIKGHHAPGCALAAFLAETAPCPTVEEMVGIAPDFTGGLSSEEYVRRLRDA